MISHPNLAVDKRQTGVACPCLLPLLVTLDPSHPIDSARPRTCQSRDTSKLLSSMRSTFGYGFRRIVFRLTKRKLGLLRNQPSTTQVPTRLDGPRPAVTGR